jgi:hypothetical protein
MVPSLDFPTIYKYIKVATAASGREGWAVACGECLFAGIVLRLHETSSQAKVG